MKGRLVPPDTQVLDIYARETQNFWRRPSSGARESNSGRPTRRSKSMNRWSERKASKIGLLQCSTRAQNKVHSPAELSNSVGSPVKRIFVRRCDWPALQIVHEPEVVPHFQIILVIEHVYFTLHSPSFMQDSRDEDSPLVVHHHDLAKILRAGEKFLWPPVTDRCGSDRGGLSKGNFLAQPHLQQFDFE